MKLLENIDLTEKSGTYQEYLWGYKFTRNSNLNKTKMANYKLKKYK